MVLKVTRKIYNEENTLGDFYIDNKFFCYTVEDKVRDYNNDGDLEDTGEEKIYGKTAIPKGEYKVVLSVSNRFKKLMPELLSVPYFKGVRIHSGNTAKDTEGCIIIGMRRYKDGVLDSRIAFNKLMGILKDQKNIKIIIE